MKLVVKFDEVISSNLTVKLCVQIWYPTGSELNPSDFSFTLVKNILPISNHFRTNFEESDDKSNQNGIKTLEYRWTKCIQEIGDYVEKQNNFYNKTLCCYLIYAQN